MKSGLCLAASLLVLSSLGHAGVARRDLAQMLDEFTSFAEQSGNLGGKETLEINRINRDGMQFTNHEQGTSNVRDVKSQFEWRRVASLELLSEDREVYVQVNLTNKVPSWTRPPNGEWKPSKPDMDHVAIRIGAREDAVHARKLLANILSSLGRKVAIQ